MNIFSMNPNTDGIKKGYWKSIIYLMEVIWLNLKRLQGFVQCSIDPKKYRNIKTIESLNKENIFHDPYISGQTSISISGYEGDLE